MRLTLPYVIKKISAWEFETFGSGGLSIGFVAGSGGQVILKDPSGAFQTFTYGGVGGGVSTPGFKIPKIGKIQLPATGTLGPMAFPSRGIVLAAAGLPGGDLAKSDIQGHCMFCEVGGGIIGGASAIGMFIGLNPLLLSLLSNSSSNPAISMVNMAIFLSSAKGMLYMGGLNAGLQAGLGGAAFVGIIV